MYDIQLNFQRLIEWKENLNKSCAEISVESKQTPNQKLPNLCHKIFISKLLS